jgi:hypothetical protein
MTISGHRSAGKPEAIRMARALVTITPPARSAAPFCAGVAGAERCLVTQRLFAIMPYTPWPFVRFHVVIERARVAKQPVRKVFLQRYQNASPLYELGVSPHRTQRLASKGRHHMSTAEDETSSRIEGEKIFDMQQYLYRQRR